MLDDSASISFSRKFLSFFLPLLSFLLLSSPLNHAAGSVVISPATTSHFLTIDNPRITDHHYDEIASTVQEVGEFAYEQLLNAEKQKGVDTRRHRTDTQPFLFDLQRVEIESSQGK